MFRRQAMVTLMMIATVAVGAPATAEPADQPTPTGASTLTGPGEVDVRRYTVSVPDRPGPRRGTQVGQPVVIELLDHDGAPASVYALTVFNLDTGQETRLYDASGTVRTELPEGRYLVTADVSTYPPGGGSSLGTYFAEPAFVVDGHTELVLDSRRGVPVDVRVDEPNAREGQTTLEFLATTPLGEVGTRMVGNSGFDHTFLAPSMTSAPEFRFGLQAELAEPDGDGGFVDSPYLYHIRWREHGRVPADLDRSFPDEQLAKVLSEHAVETPGLYGTRDGMVAATLPFSLTEYYTPDVPWSGLFTESIVPATYERSSSSYATPRVYRTGQVSHERWNTGVFGPAFPAHDPPRDQLSPNVSERAGDQFTFQIPMFTDQDPNRMGDTGTVSSATGTTELLRNGTVLQTNDYPGNLTATVPPNPGTYTLRTTAHREDFRLSTVVSSEWTFQSGHTTEPEAVPLMAVRFAPDLDLHNTAPAGRFRIPVYLQRNGTGIVDRRPTVAVSYDDGATWRTARVLRDRNQWTVELNHPADAEFVSLRATATDGSGSSTTQTTLRAYAIR